METTRQTEISPCAVLARHDALLAGRRGPRVRLDFDHPPSPGDTVLIVEGRTARFIVFDEVVRPWGPVLIVGVLRIVAPTPEEEPLTP